MAIISAGVVMNVIFAFIFAVVLWPRREVLPSIVSETIPGSPAWRAGLQAGDEIVKIGDRENPTFMQLKGGVTLGDMENGIPIVVRRPPTRASRKCGSSPNRTKAAAWRPSASAALSADIAPVKCPSSPILLRANAQLACAIAGDAKSDEVPSSGRRQISVERRAREGLSRICRPASRSPECRSKSPFARPDGNRHRRQE